MSVDIVAMLEEPRMTKICAPMVRYSKLQFRTLVRRYECDICFTPMIIANSFVQSSKARNNEFTTHKEDKPLVVQFAANTIDDFVGATEMVAPYCNGVDLNCGCPQRWAMKEGYGADLLRKPELVNDLIYQIRNRIPKPFTVSAKIRLLKDIRQTIMLCQTLEKTGASFLTIHARTPDMRNEPIDLDSLKLLRDHVRLPLIANGDVKDLESAEFLFRESRYEGIMSARGLTEECPLTKEKNYRYKLCHCCRNGLKFIIVCFVALTVIITTMLVLQILYAEDIPQSKLHGIHGAVATDYSNCSQIGTKILRRLGNAIDAAVAATICMTVVAPHKTGLGGGGYVMMHSHKNHSQPIVIDFTNNVVKDFFAEAGIHSPILLHGLEFVQKSYGNLPWRDIVEPSVKLAREGFVVSKDFVDEISKNSDYGILYGSLNPGDILQLHKLANTLDAVAKYGSKVLYNDSVSYKILYEKSLEQLTNYTPAITLAKSSMLHHHIVYYPFHTNSMQMVIEALQNISNHVADASMIESQAVVAQTLTRLYLSLLPSTQHVKRGTYTGVVATDWQDTYVCILSGLSSPLGLKNMTEAGFLLDRNVDYDNLPAFVPIIFHREEGTCGLHGLFGSDDAFLNGQILYNLIVRDLNVSTAIEYPRYHYVSDGMVIENNQRHSMEAALRARLHPMISSLPTDDSLFVGSVNAIIKRKDSLSSHSDSRGNGIASRF